MAKNDFSIKDVNIGGSAFWILMILIGLGSLSYLFIWSLFNNSVKGIAIGVIMFALIISGIILSAFKIFKWASWGDNALSFTIGFGLWTLLGSVFGKQSVFSVQQNYLFSTIASDLPLFIEVVANNFLIPIAEELFWLVGIPFALNSVMMSFKKGIFTNAYVRVATIILVSSLTFAFFHVGKQNLAFMISSIIFRSIIIIVVFGELEFDLLKAVNIGAGFGLGMHIANNIAVDGFSKVFGVLNTEPIVATIIYVFFGLIFLTGINRLIGLIVGKPIVKVSE